MRRFTQVRAAVAAPVLAVATLLALTGCVPGGTGGTTTTTTTTPPDEPIARASATPTVGIAPLLVNFDSAGSSPGTGTGLTYRWDFGDGSAEGTGPTATHLYTEPGTYSATLTMTSSTGTSTSPAITVQVDVDPDPAYYVRQSGADGDDCGLLSDPCATITRAQANAAVDGIRQIRVAGGIYAGPLELRSDQHITGGWAQDFSDFGIDQTTTIFGQPTAPAVIADGIANASLAGVSVQGVERTEGDAVGILITGGSTNVVIGSTETPDTIVNGGQGPNATGILVAEGSVASVVRTTANSGVPTGAGSSAYGVRDIEQSVVDVSLSDVTAQSGAAGADAPQVTVPPARSGGRGENGLNACGASCPGIGGDGGN